MAADITFTCRDCGQQFIFNVREQEFFAERGFGPPTRCIPCRRAHKARRQGEAGAEPGANGGRTADHRPPSGPPRQQREEGPLRQRDEGPLRQRDEGGPGGRSPQPPAEGPDGGRRLRDAEPPRRREPAVSPWDVPLPPRTDSARRRMERLQREPGDEDVPDAEWEDLPARKPRGKKDKPKGRRDYSDDEDE